MTLTPQPRRQGLPRWVVLAVAAVIAIAAGGVTGRLIIAAGGGTGPSDTVLRFFEALRDNDAHAALARLATVPDATFITDQVLAAGHVSGAISDISVPTTSSTVVPVSYTLGGEVVTDRISVQPSGTGYKISTSLNSGGIAMKDNVRDQLPLSIAGTLVSTDTVVLLPGSYPLTTVTPDVRYGTGSLTVKRLGDAPSANDLRLEVSDAGRAAAGSAVQSSLDACASQRSFTPDGCPFKLTVATEDPSTVSWTLLSQPSNDLRITISATDLSRSTVEVPLRMRISYASGGVTVTQDLPAVQAVGAVDLLTDPMTVAWTT